MNKDNKVPLKVFISYSWDSDEHKAWVKALADRLKENGIDVLLDVYQPIGTSFTIFMHDGLRIADKVLIIGTPDYKSKAESHQRSVGVEDQIINIDLSRDISTTKFIPILRKGTFGTSFPILIGDRLGFDFKDDVNFESEFTKLLNSLE